jgi:hypothetical protein
MEDKSNIGSRKLMLKLIDPSNGENFMKEATKHDNSRAKYFAKFFFKKQHHITNFTDYVVTFSDESSKF